MHFDASRCELSHMFQRRRRQSGWSGQGRTTFQQVVGLRTRRLGQVSHASSSLLCMYAFLVIVPALSSLRLAFYALRRLALRATRREHLSGCLVFYTSAPPPPVHMHERSFICNGLTTFQMPAPHLCSVVTNCKILVVR